ncbi:MAG: 3-deoxy-manno-octulosonate cytidylyltransferase [Porticoccus sp.]|jgi:3-deoxy-manno-octulosonate cytidylyltransferase (CMP-KDO synthetase)|nr:3-deoxy-manno-octulosonate cytidylyltransferase [Porticoccus sp.]
MSFTVIIPARFDSSRFPGKPLVKINGITMINHVYTQSRKSHANRVIVATDNKKIFDEVISFGGEVVMTSSDHQSGTDRLQEVSKHLNLPPEHIVVNVQGDEPLIPPEAINQVASNLAARDSVGVATLFEPIDSPLDFIDKNVVKVVVDAAGLALLFSRAAIPWLREDINGTKDKMSNTDLPMRHVGIYAYRVSMLNKFVLWPAAPIEKIEFLEQLRFMWHGERIHVDKAVVDVPKGVDTKEDLEDVIKFLTTSS